MADVADLILLAEQLILENGGETFRVEETMVRSALHLASDRRCYDSCYSIG